MFDPEDLRLAAEISDAERAVIEAAMAYYQHCQEHASCGIPPMLVPPCKRLAEAKAARAGRAPFSTPDDRT